MGFTVVGIGTYSREFAREVRDAAKAHGCEALISDDYLDVEARVAELQPELVLGTQMERHIAKRLGIPCAVISAPVHVQDFPARYAPQMGFEGANVLFDTWVHPLMMGLEEHLIGMFRGDAEFHEDAAPSHLGGAARKPQKDVQAEVAQSQAEAVIAAAAGTAAVAMGNAGTAGWRGPKVRMSRLTMPRAGRPENKVVSSVWCDSGLSKAARCTALVLASWQHK